MASIDVNAQWHGDGRTFYLGGSCPAKGPCLSARVWQRVEFDTDNVNATLMRDADTGYTEVTYFDYYNSQFVTVRRKAPKPSVASVTQSKSAIEVSFQVSGASGSNPLTPPVITPSIDFAYDVSIDLTLGQIRVTATYDQFPWHEFYIQVDNKDTYTIWGPPSGPQKNPLDLGQPARHSYLVINAPSLMGGCK